MLTTRPPTTRPPRRAVVTCAARGNDHSHHRLVAPTPPPRPLSARVGEAPIAVQVALGGVLAWAAIRAARAVAGRG